MRIDDPRRPWVPADRTNVTKTLRAHGFTPPEAQASADEANERHEAALRCMRKIQADWKNVTPLRSRT